MIVHKIWTTRKTYDYFSTKTFKYGSGGFKTRERHWEGYFLLGIIPLFIKNVQTKYIG